MREQIVMPTIRSREVVRAQRSGVRRYEDALKAFDVGNSLLCVHSVSISNRSTATVKRDGINDVSGRACNTRSCSALTFPLYTPNMAIQCPRHPNPWGRRFRITESSAGSAAVAWVWFMRRKT
jgi:hypothetical protein